MPQSAPLASLLNSKYSCSAGEHSMTLSSLHQHRSAALLTSTAGRVIQLTALVGARGLEKTVI
ncbi:hypothetical protein PGIGA_G00214720 [Pangasianodon gigas]|uniref:Uncharacterized protein n=1 Tax=Pangasianodon gigas TaxID=30993 RepID=A0ACC5WH12_PANGG|nr:hypothetical protein [Pangasianodon gigas]